MTDVPFVSCLCPTYRRPRLLANVVACFLAQDYPAERRELLILDDAGQFENQRRDGWELVSVPRRFQSLPAKFNALAGLARGDVFVVWEDDDVYLPWHVSAHVTALQCGKFSKPSQTVSLFSGRPVIEDSTNRFHGGIALTREAHEQCGGWPLTRRADFDLQVLRKLWGLGETVDPCQVAPPSYVFRWLSTRAYHGQNRMAGPDDETWYGKFETAAAHPVEPQLTLVPSCDPETSRLLVFLPEHFKVSRHQSSDGQTAAASSSTVCASSETQERRPRVADEPPLSTDIC